MNNTTISFSPRTLVICSMFVFGLVFVATYASAAQAHTASAHYPSEWTSDIDYNIGFRHTGFTGSDFTNSVHAADNPWDGISGNWFDFNWGTTDTGVTTWGGCTTVPSGGLWVGTGAISALATESTCTSTSTGNITRSSITVDRTGRTWHQGSSSSVPAGSTDLRSVLIHEFGHATGFAGHFVNSSITDCTGSDRNTMCSGLPSGTSYKRSLESHDIHTIQAAY